VNDPRDPGVDERLSDWVDGRLSSRDLERFEAELRVNPALRAQAEEYKRTVLAVRAALTGAGPRVDMVGRVLAAVQHGRIARPAGATAAATGGRRPQWWAFAASAIVGAAAIVMIALLIDWQGAGKGGGNGVRDDVAKAPPEVFRAFNGKEAEGQHKAQADSPRRDEPLGRDGPQGGGGDRRAGNLAAAVESQDKDGGRVRSQSRRAEEQVEEQPAKKLAGETFGERKGDATASAVTAQPSAAPAAPAPAQPSGAAERRAFKVTNDKPEGLAQGDGGAKTDAETELKQRTKDVAAQAKPGEAPAAKPPAAIDESKREALRREVVTQIVLSPPRTASAPEDRLKGLADSKPFDLQAVAQGLRLQALTGVPVRPADAQQIVVRSAADTIDVDKGGAGADKSVAGKPPADKAGAQKAEPEKNEQGGELARGLANRADAGRSAAGGAAGDKKAPGPGAGPVEGPVAGSAWLVDGSPQEIQAFLTRLGDAARRSGLDLQNGEADADSVLALLPVQPLPVQSQLELLQKDVEREQAAGGEKAKSAPADGPGARGYRSAQTPPAARVRLVIVLRR
jgi:hypothetical protein